MTSKRLAVLALSASALCWGPSIARAQGAVVCSNCSTEVSTLAQMAKQAAQYAEQVQSYQLQLQQYANMITNTVAIPQQMWAQVQSDIMRVQSLSNAASLLSGNSASIISRLQSAEGYAGQGSSLGNIAQQFTQWQQTIGNSASALGKTLGVQQGQEQNNAALLQALEAHSQSAAGQMQAIQAGNELAAQNAAQFQQIEATLTTTAQTQATWISVQADRQAHQDASFLAFTQGNGVSTASGAGF
jgi:type IV secretion system protein TrbJ